MSTPTSDHFKGKSVVDHLKEARAKGASASHETHGTEMPGHLAAGADSAKETAILLLILWALLSFFLLAPGKPLLYLALFTLGLAIWKTGRSALLAYARMERLHRLIEEERWEIEHHRQQERKELAEMYRAKGFEGKLLEEVLDVLMADDNRLLKVMLEEELGLTLEAYEHPLRQALGALCGVLIGGGLCLFGLFSFKFGLPIFAAVTMSAATLLSAKLEKNRALSSLLWHLALTALVVGALYFLSPLLFE